MSVEASFGRLDVFLKYYQWKNKNQCFKSTIEFVLGNT